MNEEELFYNYTPDKENITLYIQLVQYFPDFKEGRSLNLSEYSDKYCSMFDKNKFNSYHSFKKKESFSDIRNRIKDYVGFPIEVMGNFGYYGGKKFDKESNKFYNIILTYERPRKPIKEGIRRRYEYSEIKIKGSKYDSDIIEKRWVYIYINIDQCKNIKLMNNGFLLKDKEVKETKNELKRLNYKSNQLENKIKMLSSDRDRLDAENKNLKKFKEGIEEEKKKKLKQLIQLKMQ